MSPQRTQHLIALAIGHLEDAAQQLDRNQLPTVTLAGDGTNVTLRFESASGPGHTEPWLAILRVLRAFSRGEGYLSAQSRPNDWESRITAECPHLESMITELEKAQT